MRKIKEVLRLRNELKLDQRQIARSCSLSVSTVHEYLKKAAAANLTWPLPEDWDDTRLEASLFPCSDSSPRPPTGNVPVRQWLLLQLGDDREEVSKRPDLRKWRKLRRPA
jgi:transcriptional regulator with XRE-family HTH domain